MSHRVYYFETLDVYQAANQFARVLGAIWASAEGRKQRQLNRLINDCLVVSSAIAGGNAELPPERNLTTQQRQGFLSMGRSSVVRMRKGLTGLRRAGVGSVPHITAGLELLERIDSGLEDNMTLIATGFVPPWRE